MKTLSSFIPPIFLMILIFISSSIPMDVSQDKLKFVTVLTPTVQNILHIPIYGVLAYLWLNSFNKHCTAILKSIFLTLLITILYNLLDEFHQTFVPGRYGSSLDMIFNLIGIACGMVAFFLLQSNWPKNRCEAGGLWRLLKLRLIGIDRAKD